MSTIRATRRKAGKDGTLHARGDASEDTVQGQCSFQKVPNEIIGMIFGLVHLVDLPNLLCTAKWLNIAFKISPLSKRLNLVLSASCRVIGDILLQVRHSYSLQVTVQDLLSAFGHRFCTECGRHSATVDWLKSPPSRICVKCLHKPEHQRIHLTNAVRKYLNKDDNGIPVLIYRFGPDKDAAKIVQRGLIEDIIKRVTAGSNTESAVELQPYFYYGRVPPGSAKVPAFDFVRGTICHWVRCGRCREPQNRDLPHTFQDLHDHISEAHPQILDYFQKGWDKLPEDTKRHWLQDGQVSPTVRCDPSHIPHHYRPYRIWKGWAQVRLKYLRINAPTKFNTRDFQMALFNLINDRLAHCGELHDIPRDPHDTVRKDEVEFRHPDDLVWGRDDSDYDYEDDDSTDDDDDEYPLYQSYETTGEDGQDENNPTQHLIKYIRTRHLLIGDIMRAVLHAKLPGLVEEIRDEIAQDGMKAIRKWYDAMNSSVPSNDG